MAPLALGAAGALGGLGSGVAASAGTGALIGGAALGAASSTLPLLAQSSGPSNLASAFAPKQDPFMKSKQRTAQLLAQPTPGSVLNRRFSRYA